MAKRKGKGKGKRGEKSNVSLSKGGSASEGGPTTASQASERTTPPEGGPSLEGRPPEEITSTPHEGGPDVEFHNELRISMLNTLKDALPADVSPTAWACLWLSDIDKLRERVDMAKIDPYVQNCLYMSIESTAKIVQKCCLVTSVFSYT